MGTDAAIIVDGYFLTLVGIAPIPRRIQLILATKPDILMATVTIGLVRLLATSAQAHRFLTFYRTLAITKVL